jgi:hypothetical protein
MYIKLFLNKIFKLSKYNHFLILLHNSNVNYWFGNDFVFGTNAQRGTNILMVKCITCIYSGVD